MTQKGCKQKRIEQSWTGDPKLWNIHITFSKKMTIRFQIVGVSGLKKVRCQKVKRRHQKEGIWSLKRTSAPQKRASNSQIPTKDRPPCHLKIPPPPQKKKRKSNNLMPKRRSESSPPKSKAKDPAPQKRIRSSVPWKGVSRRQRVWRHGTKRMRIWCGVLCTHLVKFLLSQASQVFILSFYIFM